MSDTPAFRDAVIESKKLREVAEANAKNAIIEAVTPKLRDFITRHIMGEDVGSSDILSDVMSEIVSENEEAEMCETDESQEPSKTDEKVECNEADEKDDEKDDELILSNEMVEALAGMVKTHRASRDITERLSNLRANVERVKEISASSDPSAMNVRGKIVNRLMKESVNLHEDSIGIAGFDAASVGNEISSLIKEIATMAKSSKVRESDVFEIDVKSLLESMRSVNEADEPALDLDLDGPVDGPVDEPLDGIEVSSEGGSVEIPMSLAQELVDVLEPAVEGDEGAEEGEEASEEPDLDGGEEGEEGEEMSDDEVVEIDEAALRAELKKMVEAAKRPAGGGATAQNAVSAFGGGHIEKEVFVDGSDSDLNVHAEVKKLRTDLQNESRKNRALTKKLADAKDMLQKLQQQVNEVNLFNAKLLYTSKILTNESVNASQRTRIVTALDGAKSHDEVKLLYKGFCESLSGSRRKTVSESAVRKVGASSSRPMTAGSVTADAADPALARWSTLAGITDNNK